MKTEDNLIDPVQRLRDRSPMPGEGEANRRAVQVSSGQGPKSVCEVNVCEPPGWALWCALGSAWSPLPRSRWPSPIRSSSGLAAVRRLTSG